MDRPRSEEILNSTTWSRPDRFRGCVAPFSIQSDNAIVLTDYLSRNVVLAQHFKSFAHEHGAGAVRIVDVQSDRRKTARPNQQRISEMNIDLRHDQCREQFNQLRGHFPHFNHHHLADAKPTLFSLNNFSTPCGSLAMIRAIAESVDSETLRATTCV